MFQTLERKQTARPSAISSSGVALTASSVERVGALHRLDEEHLQAAQRVLAEQHEQHDADQHRDRQREQRRGERHRARRLRARLKPQHAPPPGARLRRLSHRPAHPLADLLDRRLARSATLGESRPLRDHDQPVADLEQLVELLAHHQHARSRRRAAPAARRGSAPRRRRRRPRSAARRSAASGSASISRPTMNFCRLPPDRLLRRRARAAGLDVEAARSARRPAAATSPRAQPAAAADRLACASAACSAPATASAPRRGRAAPRARSAGPARGAARGEARAMSVPNSVIEPGGARAVLARQRRHQLLLAVARDAGDADDLAGAHLERDVVERDAERVLLAAAIRPLHREHHRARRAPRGAAAAAARRRSSAATGWRWFPGVGSTSPVTLPPRSTVQWWHSARISSSLWLM